MKAIVRRRRARWLMILALVLPLPVSAETYYVEQNGQLQTAYGNPDEIKPKEWQIRLYKNGEPASGPNHWGLITGRTAAAVVSELKRSQDFQIRYARWAGFDYTTERLTYFNPLGPIAVIEPPKPQSVEVLRTLSQLDDLRRRITEGYRKIDLILHDKASPPSPFSEVGKVTKEYGDMLLLGAINAARIRRTLSRLEPITADLTRELAEIVERVGVSRSRVDAIVMGAGWRQMIRSPDGTCDGYRLLPGERCCQDKEAKDFFMVCARGAICPPLKNMVCDGE